MVVYIVGVKLESVDLLDRRAAISFSLFHWRSLRLCLAAPRGGNTSGGGGGGGGGVSGCGEIWRSRGNGAEEGRQGRKENSGLSTKHTVPTEYTAHVLSCLQEVLCLGIPGRLMGAMRPVGVFGGKRKVVPNWGEGMAANMGG